jgi:rhomboid protease GluP
MAVGFTPKYIVDYFFNDVTHEQFLVLINEAAKKADWKVGYISDSGIIAYTDNFMASRNAEIKIKVEHGIANIQSASTGNE